MLPFSLVFREDSRLRRLAERRREKERGGDSDEDEEGAKPRRREIREAEVGPSSLSLYIFIVQSRLHGEFWFFNINLCDFDSCGSSMHKGGPRNRKCLIYLHSKRTRYDIHTMHLLQFLFFLQKEEDRKIDESKTKSQPWLN